MDARIACVAPGSLRAFGVWASGVPAADCCSIGIGLAKEARCAWGWSPAGGWEVPLSEAGCGV